MQKKEAEQYVAKLALVSIIENMKHEECSIEKCSLLPKVSDFWQFNFFLIILITSISISLVDLMQIIDDIWYNSIFKNIQNND